MTVEKNEPKRIAEVSMLAKTAGQESSAVKTMESQRRQEKPPVQEQRSSDISPPGSIDSTIAQLREQIRHLHAEIEEMKSQMSLKCGFCTFLHFFKLLPP